VDPLTSRNCKTQVAREKREQFDSIMELNNNMGVEYIQSFQFPGQGAGVEPHVFKMLTMVDGNKVDIVRRMSDLIGDLRQCWVQFDHIKQTKGWSTMGAHVYDPGMRSLLTIAVYEFLNEKHDSQFLFWTLLNNACLKKEVHVNFRGVMADGASAN
jgi:hypothetical protein